MYLLDSNTYIQAKNFHYQMGFCPAYWDWLDQQYQRSHLASIITVYDELADGDDDLANWVRPRKSQFLSVADDAIQDKFAEIAQHVAGLNGKKPEHIGNFLGKADPWLIATASTLGATIVTHEVLDPPNSSKVKIPNICADFEVPYITTFQLLNELRAQFILGAGR